MAPAEIPDKVKLPSALEEVPFICTFCNILAPLIASPLADLTVPFTVICAHDVIIMQQKIQMSKICFEILFFIFIKVIV